MIGAEPSIYEEKYMRKQEMENHPPDADRMGNNAESIDMRQTVAAIVAKTRQEWRSPEPASPSTVVAFVNPSCTARPHFRLLSEQEQFAS